MIDQAKEREWKHWWTVCFSSLSLVFL